MFPASASTGCLVLDEVTFPEDEPAQTLVSDAPDPEIRIGSVISMPESRPSVSWDVQIHDKNVRDSLRVRLFQISRNSRQSVDNYGCDNDTGLDTVELVADGTETRSHKITINRPLAPCSQLMLVAANSFEADCREFDGGLSSDAFDLLVTRTNPRDQAGVAIWWIVTPETAEDPLDMSECESLFTLPEANAQ